MYHYVRPIKNSKYYKIKGLEIDGFKTLSAGQNIAFEVGEGQ